MADRTVFQPLTSADLTGPFSGFLTPPSQTQAEKSSMQAPAPMGALGGIASVASAFLEGATKQRQKNYQEQENAKLQKVNALNSFMSQIMNDQDLTPEAKQKASQVYYRALGGEILETSKGGKGGGKGEEQGAHHHFANIMKDLATGMTGGKAPKGAPDIGSALTSIQAAIYGQDGKPKPEYALVNRSAQFASQADAVFAKYPPGTPPETIAGDRDLANLKYQWERLDQNGADSYFKTRAAAYPATPSAAAMELEISKIHPGTSASQQAGPPASVTPTQDAPNGVPRQDAFGRDVYSPKLPGGRIANVVLTPQPTPIGRYDEFGRLVGGYGSTIPADQIPGPPVPATAKSGVPGGGFTGLTLSGQQFSYLLKQGRVSSNEEWESADGRRMAGNVVNLQDGAIFVDRSGRQIDLDVNKLIPWQGVQSIDLVDPKNPYNNVRAVEHKGTGVLYDPSTGIPLPPAQQNWAKTTSQVRPPSAQNKPSYIDSQGHPVFRQSDGTFKTATDTVYDKPDRWVTHYNMQLAAGEAKDARTMYRQLTTQHNQNLVRIRQAGDNRKAALDKNATLAFNPKALAAKKQEAEDQTGKELADESQVYREGVASIGPEFLELEPPSPGKKKGDSPAGLQVPGNIDLSTRPVVKNSDGSISTVRSASFREDGKEILVPTVSDDGRILSTKEAIDLYHKTGKHLGIFDSPEHATRYAQQLHEQQGRQYKAPGKASPGPPKSGADSVAKGKSLLP